MPSHALSLTNGSNLSSLSVPLVANFFLTPAVGDSVLSESLCVFMHLIGVSLQRKLIVDQSSDTPPPPPHHPDCLSVALQKCHGE